MLATMTAEQFLEWRAYADLEPFDEERADYRAAQVVQTLLNVNRKKGHPVIPLRDCVLQFSSDSTEGASRARDDMRASMKVLMLAQDFARRKRKGRKG